MLRRCNRVPIRCVDDEDPCTFGRNRINVVNADTSAADDAQLRSRCNQRGIHLDLRPYDERIRLAEGGDKGFAGLTREFVNRVPRSLERVNANGCNGFSDDDGRHYGRAVRR